MSRKPDREQDYQTLLDAHTFEVARAKKAEALLVDYEKRWQRAKRFAEQERGTHPDWGCRTCGCLWRDNADDSVSLYNQESKSCAACEKNTLTACDTLTMLAALTRLENSNDTKALSNPPCANCGHGQTEHQAGQCSGSSSLGECECKYHVPKLTLISPVATPLDLGPFKDCPQCKGSGRCDNAQFACSCRWSNSPLRSLTLLERQ